MINQLTSKGVLFSYATERSYLTATKGLNAPTPIITYNGAVVLQNNTYAIIDYAFTVLKAKKLFAGHNPNNIASQKVLSKLGFSYVRDEFYEPTGLFHPSYELVNPN